MTRIAPALIRAHRAKLSQTRSFDRSGVIALKAANVCQKYAELSVF